MCNHKNVSTLLCKLNIYTVWNLSLGIQTRKFERQKIIEFVRLAYVWSKIVRMKVIFIYQ